MSSKIVTMVVCSAVAIMLIGSILMPIINDASTDVEETDAEGGYGFMSYQSEPEPSEGGMPYRYVYAIKSGDDMVISKGPANAMTEIETVPYTDFLNIDRIYYADSNIVFYVSSGALYYIYNEQTVEVDRPDVGFWVQNSGSASRASAGTGTIYSTAALPTYYYVDDPSGDYANFEGDNPPSMDTPIVTAAGMYIGPLKTITEKPTIGASIYLAIPVILLAALLVSVVATFRSRD